MKWKAVCTVQVKRLRIVVEFRSKPTLLANWIERTMNNNIYLWQLNVLGDVQHVSGPSGLVSAAGWQSNIKVSKAACCPTCFEQTHFVLSCQMAHDHCRPGVTCCSSLVKETKLFNIPPSCSELQYTCITACSMEAMHSVHPSCLIACAWSDTTALCYRFLVSLSHKQVGGLAQINQSTNQWMWGKAPVQSEQPKPQVLFWNAQGSQQMEWKVPVNVHLLKVDNGILFCKCSSPGLCSIQITLLNPGIIMLSQPPNRGDVESDKLLSPSHLYQINSILLMGLD